MYRHTDNQTIITGRRQNTHALKQARKGQSKTSQHIFQTMEHDLMGARSYRVFRVFNVFGLGWLTLVLFEFITGLAQS